MKHDSSPAVEIKLSAKEYRELGFKYLDEDDYFRTNEYFEKAIENDSLDTEKKIIISRLKTIAVEWISKGDDHIKKGNLSYANRYWSDADLILVLAYDYDYPNQHDIGKLIYQTRVKLGDMVGADLYKEYK